MMLAQQELRQVELRDPPPAGAGAEVEPVAVDHPGLRPSVEDADRRRDEARSQPVVGVERQDVAAARRADPPVARRGEAGVRLADDVVPPLAQRRDHLQGARLPGAVVDHDQLAGARGAPLHAGHGLDQELAELETRDDHREVDRARRAQTLPPRRLGAPEAGRGEVGGLIELGEQPRAVRGGGRHQRDQRVGGIERAEEGGIPQLPERHVPHLQAELLPQQGREARGVAQQRVGAHQHRAIGMPAVEIQQVAVVEGPDGIGPLRVVQEDVRPQALHRVRHFPGESIRQDVEGVALQDLVPEVEQQGGPRVLPPPDPGRAGAAGDDSLSLPGVAGEGRAIEPLALRPPPVLVPGLVRRPCSPSGCARATRRNRRPRSSRAGSRSRAAAGGPPCEPPGTPGRRPPATCPSGACRR